MRLALTFVATAWVVAAALPAQDTKGARIKAKISEMRKAITEGRPITTNVRVKVKLRNGNKITGVVKSGRFIESVDSLDFVPADMTTPGAGIRVWYFDDTNSFIFMSFDSIASYRIGARLTDVQVQQIEARIAAERTRVQAMRKAMVERKRLEKLARDEDKAEREAEGDVAENGETTKPTKPADVDPMAKQQAKENTELMALLDEFPPEEGWGQEKVAEIQRRKIVLHVFPDEKQQRFLDVFDKWKQALSVRQQREQAQGAPAKKSGTATAQPPKS